MTESATGRYDFLLLIFCVFLLRAYWPIYSSFTAGITAAILISFSIILWQITSMNFIKRLTEDYREYVDLIQPIQVAVYEMKLGLAIALSGSLQREYLRKIKEGDINRVLVCV